MSNKSPVEQLEEGRRRLDAATQRRTRIQVELEAARRQLNEAKVEAELEYGTSNIEELRALFRKREDENIAAVTEFLEALGDLEAALTKTEQALAS